MLVFPFAQAQMHLEQHHSTVEESYRVRVFCLAQTQVHLEQHHSIVGES
jgi:hypothetical protein